MKEYPWTQADDTPELDAEADRQAGMMSAEEFAEWLRFTVESDEILYVETYADAGLLTRDAGLVFRLTDGTEYQVTVVRSR